MERKSQFKHRNGSKLHMNKKGTSILSNTSVESIYNALQWRSIINRIEENRSGSCMNN